MIRPHLLGNLILVMPLIVKELLVGSKNTYLKNKKKIKDFDLIVFNKTKTKDVLLIKNLII